MGRLILIIVMTLLVATPAVAQKNPLDLERAPGSVRRGVARALILRQKGELEEARAALLRLTASSGHHLAWYHLGGVYVLQDSLTAAADAFAAAVAVEPALQPAWRNLGETSYALGDYTRAAEAFAEAAARDPDGDPELVHFRGVALLQAGRAGEALNVLERLVADHPDAPVSWFRNFVAAAVEADQPRRADGAMDVLTTGHPGDPMAWDLAYRQAAATEDHVRAASLLTIRGYLEPLDRAEAVQLGDLCLAIEAPERAVTHYRAALGLSGPPGDGDIRRRLVSAQLSARDREGALATLDAVLASAPDAETWRLKGEIHYEQAAFAAALAAFDQAAALAPDDRGLDLLRGYCALELEHLVEARRHFEAAAADPRHGPRAQEVLRHLERMASP